MNYYLSVIPYFGAMQAGVVPSISVLGPANNSFGEFFCTSLDQCASVVRPWTNFFKQVNATANSCQVSSDRNSSSSEILDTTTSRTKYQYFPIASSLDFNLTPGMETTLSNLWSAHLNSIGYASKLFPQSLAAMSAEESKFGLSWSNLVDFIAAANFNCNFVITNVLQNLLPKRVLTTGDTAPMISDMTRLENRAILFIEVLDTANVYSASYLEKVWDYSMCTEPARALGREIITLGVYRPSLIIRDGFELLPLIKNQSKIICLK